MFDLMKKMMLTGVGLAAMTKDRLEEMAREVARQTEMSAEKGEQFVDEVLRRGEQARGELNQTVRTTVNDALHRMDLPTRADLDDLRARISVLEQRLAAHEGESHAASDVPPSGGHGH